MRYTSARDPKFLDPDHSKIGIVLTTPDFGDLDFVVQAYDFDPFAVEIFIRSIHGDFGKIATYEAI